MKSIKYLAILLIVPIIVAATCTAPAWTGIIGAIENNAAANEARAKAEENRASADLEEAQALADTVERYTTAGVKAINADLYTAHPWLFLVDAARLLAFICGGVVGLALLAFAVMFWRNSEHAMLTALALIKRMGF